MEQEKETQQPTLTIKIDYEQNIDLHSFNDAMQSIENQYNTYLRKSNAKKQKARHKLYLKEVRKGSIEIVFGEQITNATEMLPIVTPFIGEFASYTVSTMDYLTGKAEELKHELGQKDLSDFRKIFNLPIQFNGNINLTFINLGKQEINQTYNAEKSAIGQNKCTNMIEEIKDKQAIACPLENMPLVLYQARNSRLSKVGDMGIIGEVCTKEQVLSYADDDLRVQLTEDTKPFNFTYMVDVDVILRDADGDMYDEKNIKEYRITVIKGVRENHDIFSAIEDQTTAPNKD